MTDRARSLSDALDSATKNPWSVFEYPEIAAKRLPEITFAITEAMEKIGALGVDVTDPELKAFIGQSKTTLFSVLMLFTMLDCCLKGKDAPPKDGSPN